MSANRAGEPRYPSVNLLDAHRSGARRRRPAAGPTALVAVALLVWGLTGLAVLTLLGWHAPLQLLGRL